MGAFAMSPDKFLATAHEARADVARRLEVARNAAPPNRVEDRIDTHARRHMQNLRKKLGDYHSRSRTRP